MVCDSERLELALVNGLECERLMKEIENENASAVAWYVAEGVACTVCGSHDRVTWAIPGLSAYCEECWQLFHDACCTEEEEQ